MNERDLSIGMSGEDVAALQDTLQKYGFYIPPIETDRNCFGPATQQAVAQFQKDHRLAVTTGIADDRFATAMEGGATARSSTTASSATASPVVPEARHRRL